ncbi:transient receptor potential cation channel subfamily A member 1, partial [Exaiptasia diaphana]|uniref:Uncharacterized protein n=1 Tax=Exaiptasia diaphana TaxID=2652724 RepID=A0A913XEL7_EXADI
MSKKHLVIEEGPNGSVAMSEISNGTEQVELGHTNLAGMDTPQRRRKLTSISMNSSEGSEAEVAGEESGDDSDKITPKRSKAQQLKDAIMSGDISEVENLLNQKIDVNLSDGFGRSPLHNAVLKGIPSIVDILLKSGADVNKKDDREDSAVHYAARVGNPQVLTLILSNPECDVNLKGSSLNSPLHIAASLNKPDLCQILLEYHANPNSQEENGKSPLGRAVESGAANSAKYLFEHMKGLGIPSDTILYNQDFDGTTLLHLAVDSGFSQVVELCLENGALIRQPRRIDRTTAFHMACEQGSTAIVQLLVQYDPKISKILLVNAEGITPLHQAALSNSHGIAEILINNGADVNARTNENRTPLMFAAKRGGVDTVRLLLEKGADPTLKDIDGRTAVYDAIGYPMTAEVILEDPKLDPMLTEKDLTGFSVAHYAAKSGDAKSMSLFLEHNKAVGSTVSDQLDTPLHVAAKYGTHEVVRVILEKQGGKIINAQNSRNRTALHLACSGGHYKAAILLLDKGATIERDQNNRTALHEAAQNGAKKVVEKVISKHSHCLNYVDDDKNTALHLAVKNCRSEIIHLLLSLRKQEILKNTSNQTILDLAVQLDDSAGAMAIAQHDRWREILESCTHGVTNMMKKLCVKMPDVTEQIFDNCIEIEGEKVSQEHKIKYDLGVILRKSSPEVKSSLEILEVIADNRIE